MTSSSTPRKPKISKRTLIFALLCMAAGILLGYVTFQVNHAKEANFSAPPVPSWMPDGAVLLGRGKPGVPLELSYDQQSYAITYGDPVAITVLFEKTMGVDTNHKGVWRGENAQVQVLSPFSETFTGRSYSSTWGDRVIFDVSGKTPNPHVYLDVTLPLEEAYYHQTLALDAGIDVTYPKSVSAYEFENTTIHLERQVNLFLISPGDEKILLDRQHSIEKHNSNFFIVLLGIIAMLFFWVGFVTIAYNTTKIE